MKRDLYSTSQYRTHFKKLNFNLVDNDITQLGHEESVKSQRRLAEVQSRPRQAKFRRKVFERWDARCLITGCTTEASLEAAHIVPVMNEGRDEAWNGLPLRADIHRLFDADLIWIDADKLCIAVAKEALDDYGEFNGRELGSVLDGIKDANMTKQALRERDLLL